MTIYSHSARHFAIAFYRIVRPYAQACPSIFPLAGVDMDGRGRTYSRLEAHMQPRKPFDNVADSFCHFVRCERGYSMKNEAEAKQIASFLSPYSK